MPKAALEELPRFIAPMLASAQPAPTGAGWALEVKWDGIRAQLSYDGAPGVRALAAGPRLHHGIPSWPRSPTRSRGGA